MNPLNTKVFWGIICKYKTDPVKIYGILLSICRYVNIKKNILNNIIFFFFLNWTNLIQNYFEDLSALGCIVDNFLEAVRTPGRPFKIKIHEEIPQEKMFNPNLYKNKSYDMNFIHKDKNMSYITYLKCIKFMSYDLFFYKFVLNIFPWGISSCL